jgi:hypothetical protein
MSAFERFQLLDGSPVATGLLMPEEQDIAQALKAPMYDQNLILSPKDIERSLAGDRWKSFRRLRAKLIVNQSTIGKCCPSSVIGALHNRRMLDGMSEVMMADSHLYMNINGGGDNGSQLVHAMDRMVAKGISPVNLMVNGREAKFPLMVFNRRQVNPALLKAADQAALTYQVFEPFRVPNTSYELFRDVIASAIARDQQIVVAVHVGRLFMSLRNGYMQQSPGFGNHAVLVHSGKWVGGTELVHPDIQNSWGPSSNPLLGPTGGEGWGDRGFGLSTMEGLYQCAKTHVFWVFPGSKFNPGAR